MTGPRGPARVAILLGTLQGAPFLSQQLDSFLAQTWDTWQLWVSDDGSTDGTRALLAQYRDRLGEGRLQLVEGPARGVAANFLSLICRDEVVADYYAYADQDDVWNADKLQRAAAWLATVPEGIPALYCSRTRLVDAQGRDLGLSTRFRRPPCFANALVQNIAGGNTMVFNQAARRLLRTGGAAVPVVAHDWWTYLLVAGAGGRVHYDAAPTLRYRQHEANLMGANTSWRARLQRVALLRDGVFRRWNDDNIAALRTVYGLLAPENQRVLERFARAREGGLIARLAGLCASGVYRQTVLGNLGLLAAAVFRKL